MKFAISAGHFARAQGAAFGEFTEWKEAVIWQQLICDRLGPQAYAVPPGSLTHKIQAVNRAECDAAIEIHFNSAPGYKARGHETLYCPNSLRGLRLATFINSSLIPFCAPNRGAKEGWYRMDRPGHYDYDGDREGDELVDAFLKRTNCPAAIVEPFFIHEVERIQANREACCDAMTQALIDWSRQ